MLAAPAPVAEVGQPLGPRGAAPPSGEMIVPLELPPRRNWKNETAVRPAICLSWKPATHETGV